MRPITSIKNDTPSDSEASASEPKKNNDISGKTGGKWDIPGLQASDLRSNHEILKQICRGLNNSVGLAALTVNSVNNAAGTLFFDLPAQAESLLISHGGPSYQELTVSAQTATPGMPLDDAVMWGLSKVASFSKSKTLASTAMDPLLNAEFRSGQLEAHFIKHTGEWLPEGISREAYLARAKKLLNGAAEKNILSHQRLNGDILRYNVHSNEFVVGVPDAAIRTFFRPREGLKYWQEAIKK